MFEICCHLLLSGLEEFLCCIDTNYWLHTKDKNEHRRIVFGEFNIKSGTIISGGARVGWGKESVGGRLLHEVSTHPVGGGEEGRGETLEPLFRGEN